MPSQVHHLFTTQLQGLSLFNTCILAIVMREEVRTHRTGFPQRPILRTYRCAIVSAFIVFVGSDCVTAFLLYSGINDIPIFGHFFVSVIVVYVCMAIFIGVYYIRTANALSVPLLAYMRARAALGHRNVNIGVLRLTSSFVLFARVESWEPPRPHIH